MKLYELTRDLPPLTRSKSVFFDNANHNIISSQTMNYAMIFGLLMTLLSEQSLALSISNKTDLAENGNTYVLNQHRSFIEKDHACVPRDESKFRVLIQGFSLFSGVEMNISGAVVDTLAALPLSKRSLLEANDNGSRAVLKELEINGVKIEACLVVSEVLWDLAAANLIHLANQFRPDFILMSGRGGQRATIETGGRNKAGTLAGYIHNGTYSADLNRPRSQRVDPRFKSSKVIPSTWNHEAIYAAINPLIEKLGHKVEIAKAGRSDNDYICNNIHYSLLQAAAVGDIELAGGLLRPGLELEAMPSIGFFHYPSNTLKENPEEELENWSLVIKQLIGSQLNL